MADILPARTILTGQVSTKLWADPNEEARRFHAAIGHVGIQYPLG